MEIISGVPKINRGGAHNCRRNTVRVKALLPNNSAGRVSHIPYRTKVVLCEVIASRIDNFSQAEELSRHCCAVSITRFTSLIFGPNKLLGTGGTTPGYFDDLDAPTEAVIAELAVVARSGISDLFQADPHIP